MQVIQTADSGATDNARAANAMRILIVDDNEALAQTTGWLVEMLGHDYRLAANGPQAIDLVRDYKPDVVMLDIGLPGMSGYDLCQHLRKEPHLANAVFIAQTGWGDSEHRRLTHEAGFHHHMVKPVYAETLQALLESIMQGNGH